MAVAICATVAFNYSAARESKTLSNSLKQLAMVVFAVAEEGEPDNCISVWDSEPFEDYCDCGEEGCSGMTYSFFEWEYCDGTVGSCTTSEYSWGMDCKGEVVEYLNYSEETDC